MPSKSARKREQLALQSLGEELIPLDLAELEALPLDEALFEAVLHARDIRSHSALRRQRQLIGKLMRNADVECIRSILRERGQQTRLDKDIFREAEQWRDRIAADAGAVAGFAERTGARPARLDELRAELNTAKDERSARSIRRRIFRDVHAALAAAGKGVDPGKVDPGKVDEKSRRGKSTREAAARKYQ